jgi:epoxyqueuosine reductase
VSRLTEKIFNWINTEALKLGFLECAPLILEKDSNYESYNNWVNNEHHQPLDYLNKNLDKREYPAKLGHNLNSAIVFLHPYPIKWRSKYIAKYASGDDYHYILREKLNGLSQNFSKQWGLLDDEKICVDTIPILERSLAQKSGLGWIGKNGCLISRKHGSFTLLSVWLISLEYTAFIKNSDFKNNFHCGSCTRCMDACPTDAFIEPGKLNVQDCLSTQTIENRKSIQDKYFKAIKTTAFGCDICQDVCPWNRKQFIDRYDEYLPPLAKLLLMEDNEFRSYFRKTPLIRPGWAGLKRNFLILASNDPTIPKSTFQKYTMHENEIISQTAIKILASKK